MEPTYEIIMVLWNYRKSWMTTADLNQSEQSFFHIFSNHQEGDMKSFVEHTL